MKLRERLKEGGGEAEEKFIPLSLSLSLLWTPDNAVGVRLYHLSVGERGDNGASPSPLTPHPHPPLEGEVVKTQTRAEFLIGNPN